MLFETEKKKREIIAPIKRQVFCLLACLFVLLAYSLFFFWRFEAKEKKEAKRNCILAHPFLLLLLLLR